MNTTPSLTSLSRAKMFLFTFAAGAMIANIYYLQPLLPVLAADFGLDPSRSGYLVTFTQAGYALGVLLLVPLGDTMDPRRLLSWLLSFNITGSVLAATSQNFSSFAAASIVLGITSAATMVLVPYVASLAPAESRGEKVGQMMTGALLGILLAWTVAGLVADLAGWHAMYYISSVVVAFLLFSILRAIPKRLVAERTTYRQLLVSVFEVARAFPELRWRSFYGALGLASFSAMWTGLPLLLSAYPYNLSSSTIGFFGLTGVAGALFSPVVGRLGDRGWAQKMTCFLTVTLLAAWFVASRAGQGIWIVILGAVLLNIGVMGLQVTHQSVIYRLDAAARSRITAIFITFGFVGAALGSAAAMASFTRWGWIGVCAAGAALPVVLLGSWGFRSLILSRQQQAAVPLISRDKDH